MRACFVGLGRMGLEMATHTAGAGFEVRGVDIDPEARRRAGERGLDVSADLGAVGEADVVLSSLPDTEHVREVYLAPNGVFDRATAGVTCVDLSTIAPAASVEIAGEARARGVGFLDAPVSGTSLHAAQGSLAIMVGGEAADLERVRPVLATFSASIHHVGGNGDGLVLKLITNRLLAAHLIGIAEAIVSMEAADLDVSEGIEFLRGSAVPLLLDYKAGPLAARDYTPQFTVGLMRKDLRLADEALPPGAIAATTVSIFDQAVALGLGDDDIAAVMAIVEGDGASRVRGR